MEKVIYKTAIDRMRDGHCPVCGQSNVEWGESHMGLPCCQGASCQDCGATWRESYTLTGIEIEEYPDPDMDMDIENDLSNIENIPEILEAILTQKRMLPALLGLDKEFDRLITERLA